MKNKAFLLLALTLAILALPLPAPGFQIIDSHNMGGQFATGLAFDEEYGTIWVAVDNVLHQLDPAMGWSTVSQIDVSPFNTFATGLSVHPATGNVWVTDQGLFIIHEVDRITGQSVRTVSGQRGLAFDNEGYLWSGPNGQMPVVNRIDTTTDAIIGDLYVDAAQGGFISGLAFDHVAQTIWIAVSFNTYSTLVHVGMDGTLLAAEEFTDPDNPSAGLNGIAFDSMNNELLVVSMNMMNGTTIYRLSLNSCIDDDGDGFSIGGEGCAPEDCDDNDWEVFPGNPELCDGKDNDCNGMTDEGLTFDADGDGYSAADSCGGTRNDCDDSNLSINPAAAEVCNGIDDNCNLAVDEGDGDGDGIDDCVDRCPAEDATGFDADMDGCIDSLDGLEDFLDTLGSEEVIEEEIQDSLVSKVDNAAASAGKDSICAAVNKLDALKNQVNAQRGKKISEDAADDVISYVDSLIEALLSQLPEGESC